MSTETGVTILRLIPDATERPFFRLCTGCMRQEGPKLIYDVRIIELTGSFASFLINPLAQCQQSTFKQQAEQTNLAAIQTL